MNSQWVVLRGEPKSQLLRIRMSSSSSELWRRQDVSATHHIPTSTNSKAQTYIHEQHGNYLHPRTTHDFIRKFRSGRVRRELVWTESWKLLSQGLEFLQRTQKGSINFILYCTPQVYKVLSCFVVFLKKFW